MICIQRCLAVLAGLGAILLALAAASPAALAVPPPAKPAPPVPVTVHTVGGMPGWQIILIAAGATLLAAAVAVLVDRARAARQRVTQPPRTTRSPGAAPGPHVPRPDGQAGPFATHAHPKGPNRDAR